MPSLRQRKEADIDSCIQVLKAVYAFDGYPTRWPEGPSAWLSPKGFLEAWVAVDDSRVVGHATLIRAEQIAQPFIEAAAERARNSFAEVSRLFVHPRIRRTGIGRMLLDRAVEAAAELGLIPIIEVNQKRGPATRLYESAGWQVVGSGPADWIDQSGERPTLQYYMLQRA